MKSSSSFTGILKKLPLEIVLQVQTYYIQTFTIHEVLNLLNYESWTPVIKLILQNKTFSILHHESITFPRIVCSIDKLQGQLPIKSHEFRKLFRFLESNDIHPKLLRFGRILSSNGSLDKCSVSISQMIIRTPGLEELVRLSQAISTAQLYPDDMDMLFNYDLQAKFVDVSLPVTRYCPWSCSDYGNFKLCKFDSLINLSFEIVEIDGLAWCAKLFNSKHQDSKGVISEDVAYLGKLPCLKKINFSINLDVDSCYSQVGPILEKFANSIHDFENTYGIPITLNSTKAFTSNSFVDPHTESLLLKYFRANTTSLSIEVSHQRLKSQDWSVNLVDGYLNSLKNCPNLQSLSIKPFNKSVLPLDCLNYSASSLKHLTVSDYQFINAKSNYDEIPISKLKHLETLTVIDSTVSPTFFNNLPNTLQRLEILDTEIFGEMQVALQLPSFLHTFRWKSSTLPFVLKPYPVHLSILQVDQIPLSCMFDDALSHNICIPSKKMIIGSVGAPTVIPESLSNFTEVEDLEVRNKRLADIEQHERDDVDIHDLNLNNIPKNLKYLKLRVGQFNRIIGTIPKTLVSLDLELNLKKLKMLTEISTSWRSTNLRNLILRYAGSSDLDFSGVELTGLSSVLVKLTGSVKAVRLSDGVPDSINVFKFELNSTSNKSDRVDKLIVNKVDDKIRDLGITRKFNVVEELSDEFSVF